VSFKTSDKDPYVDSWWYMEHEKELASVTQPGESSSTHGHESGPVSRMLNMYQAYIVAIRESIHAQEPDALESLQAKVKAEYPNITWKMTHQEHAALLDEIEQRA
jgi:hypothetical protein